ncbi:MAG: hypothetical protein WDW36_003176 [Sanguina aurantia]
MGKANLRATEEEAQRLIEADIITGLSNYLKWRNILDGERRMMLQVCVRLGDELLLDTVEWDLSKTSMTPLRYASDLCHDMGLGLSWTQAITRHVGARMEELQHDLHKFPVAAAAAYFLPPAPSRTSCIRAVPLPAPCVVQYTEALDTELERKRVRRRHLDLWELQRKQAEALSQRQSMEDPSQAEPGSHARLPVNTQTQPTCAATSATAQIPLPTPTLPPQTAGLTPDGKAALHGAAMGDSYEAAALLACNGADLEAKDNGGQTPLATAVSAGAKATTVLLLVAGCSIEAANEGLSMQEDQGARAEELAFLQKWAEGSPKKHAAFKEQAVNLLAKYKAAQE